MTRPSLDASQYRRLNAEQRALIDGWLDRAGITRAVRIKRGMWCRTLVLVVNADQTTTWLPVSDPPFPWEAVAHAADAEIVREEI